MNTSVPWNIIDYVHPGNYDITYAVIGVVLIGFLVLEMVRFYFRGKM